jgi:ParB-like chromosome segregation protein Spo0J
MEQKNQNLYLAPEQLTANEANEKARPAEKPEDRALRVAQMAASIVSNGQEYPVLIIKLEDDGVTTYEYVDGGCRVEAIAKLNEDMPDQVRTVWCSVVDPNDDLFKKAVVANLHRTQNSILDMGHIIQEVGDRQGWKGKGAGKKIAEYLGIGESRVSEFKKILAVEGPVKVMIESGEVSSADAALKLMAVKPEHLESVSVRAKEIAKEDDDAAEKKAKAKRAHNPNPKVPEFKTGKHKPNIPKVKAKHVEQAKRETGVSPSPRPKSEIVAFFELISPAAYGPKAVAFAEYMVKWMGGEGTDRTLREKFDALADTAKKSPAPKAKPAKVSAKKKK